MPRSRRGEIFNTRAEQPDASSLRLRSRLVSLTLARLVVASGLLTVALVGASGAPSTAFTSTIALLYAASIAYAAWLSRGRNLRRLAQLQIALDLSAYVAIAVVTGGPASPLGFFVAVPALSAALVLGSAAARVTAAASAISYGLVTVAYLYRWPELVWLGQRLDLPREELAVQLVAHGVAIPLVAALGGALAERLRRAGGALAALEEQRADLAALHEDVLRSIPVGLLTVDLHGRIDGANPEAEALLGPAQPALLGAAAREALSFVDASAWGAQGTRSGQAGVRGADGERSIAWTVSSLLDSAGRVRGQLVVLEDRSQSEALRAQVERAERLAVLGRLAAGLAHEIRNPLGAISGCVELVRESDALGGEDRELLGTVLKESQRLNRLVGDMLAFARPRPPERERVDLVALVRDFAAMAAREQGRVSLHFDDARGPSTLWASVDPQQLRQVLWNLVRNAAQASPDGARVDLWLARAAERCELSVADRGSGISAEAKERIFEEFYSEGSARGTGLGLALVRQIVEAHGGSIEHGDRDGGGTVFVVKLPAE